MNFMVLLTSTQNLFDEQWIEGDLYSIQGLVSSLGGFCCTVISIVGFGIVIFSILKNALSGLYVVNPKFWDKVDEVKRGMVDGASRTIGEMTGNGNVAAQKLGGALTFILGYIPNIKDLTDFEDGVEIDKKQYFARSLPLLVAQIFIGMLIFYGYPAKIANWVGSGATYALSAVLNNVDPVEFIVGVSDNFVVYNLATDGSSDPFDKNINKMTSEMMGVVKTRYNDIQKDPAQETAYHIESQLLSAFSNGDIQSVLGAVEGYSYNIQVSAQTSMPVLSNVYQQIGQSGVYKAVATNGTVSFRYWLNGTSLPTGSTKVGNTDFFVWTVTATPVSLSEVSSSSVIMAVNAPNPTGIVAGQGASIRVPDWKIGSGAGSIKGALNKSTTVTFYDGTGKLLHTGSVTITVDNIMNTTDAVATLVFDISCDTQFGVADYCIVALPGEWSYTVTSASTNTPVTLDVESVRVDLGGTTGTKPKFASSMWNPIMTDVSQWMEIDSASVNKFLTTTELPSVVTPAP